MLPTKPIPKSKLKRYVLKEVPTTMVDQVVSDFRKDGAIEVNTAIEFNTAHPEKTWQVEAIFPAK